MVQSHERDGAEECAAPENLARQVVRVVVVGLAPEYAGGARPAAEAMRGAPTTGHSAEDIEDEGVEVVNSEGAGSGRQHANVIERDFWEPQGCPHFQSGHR